jgi:hypothetical protein
MEQSDRNGIILAVGDLVTIQCRIRGIADSVTGQNLDLETVVPSPGLGPTAIAVNAKQVVK